MAYFAAHVRSTSITASLDILEVTQADRTAERLWGCWIDQPVRGAQVSSASFYLMGWVLGRQCPAVAVQVMHGGVVLRRTSLNHLRPDVAAAFPYVPGAERSGFRTTLSLPIKPELELLVQAVLQDQSRVPLGFIRTRLCWREGTAPSDVPLISVIIPCYNQAHFLTDSIESILSQTYPHHEIVVVDDGSTDNTGEVACRYPGVRCFRQENRGLAAARNTGIRTSNGDYLVFLDADDRLLPHALEVGLDCLRAHPECAFVFGRCRIVGIDGAPLPGLPGCQQPHFNEDYYGSLLRGNYIWMPAMVMYRRAVFESVKAFSPQMKGTEDYALYLQVTRNFPIYFHGQEVAEYRQHHASMTSNTAVMLRSSLAALRKEWRYVKANPQYKEAYRVGLRFWRTHYGGRLATELPNQIRLGQWKRALSRIALLLRYYPRGLAAVLHDRFVLWKYVRAVPAYAEETDAADKAIKAKAAGAALLANSDDGSGALKHRVRAIPNSAAHPPTRILVTGWFSFEDGHATAGDLLACELVREWLEDAGCQYDVALVASIGIGVDWRSVDPECYSHVVFVCGPFGNGPNVMQLIDRFARCRLVGVNLSMRIPLDQWNPFNLLLERDSSASARPDIAFLSRGARVPIVGVILVEPYEGAADQVTNEAIDRLIQSRAMVIVRIDTRLDTNGTGLRSAAEVESLIARMDLVITTRLHGLVLALKNGVPAVAIDPIPGGFKIERQARTVGWPVVLPISGLTNERLEAAFDFCLTEDARRTAEKCYKEAVKTAKPVKDEFISFFRKSPENAKSIVEIVDISGSKPDPERLWGCWIDQPVCGAQVSGGSVELLGWVLGRQYLVVAVEVVHESIVVRRVSLDLPRPDVAAAFPHVPGAERSGFRTTLSLPTIKPDLELVVQAVLQDESRLPLVVIRTRLCCERHD